MSAKRPRLTSAELDALTYEDGSLFHDGRGRPVAMPVAPAPLADTHGHLTNFSQHDPAAAIARASLAGVALLGVPLDPADDARDAAATLAAVAGWVDAAAAHVGRLLAAGVAAPRHGAADALLAGVRVWAGVHPYNAVAYNADERVRDALATLLASDLCVGVGEFGLDLGPYNRCPAAEQERAFVAQLRLAHELGLPVQLHLRDPAPSPAEPAPEPRAHLLALRVLEREGVPAAGCDLHCCTSGPEVVVPFSELGCHVAFGGAATFARSDAIRAAAAACPAELLLSETDSPFMAPVPLRGQECEPAMVAFAAATVAAVRAGAGVAAEADTYAALWANARTLLEGR